MIVVADTSVILNLCCVKQAELLPRLFHEIVIPPEVASEFVRLTAELPRFIGLTLPTWIRQQPCSSIPETLAAEGLDEGETAALALALEIRADAVLVDERRGYETARRLGLNVVGVLGILLRAKVSGFLSQIGPVIVALRRDAEFWISEEVRDEVLRLAGEDVA